MDTYNLFTFLNHVWQLTFELLPIPIIQNMFALFWRTFRPHLQYQMLSFKEHRISNV